MKDNDIHRNVKAFISQLLQMQQKEAFSAEDEDVLWNRIEKANQKYTKTKRVRIYILSSGIAASIAVLAIAAWNFQRWPQEKETDYLSIINTEPQENLPSSNIQLLLSENQRLSLDGKEVEIDYQQDGDIIVNDEKLDVKEEEEKTKFNQLIVPAGKRSFLTLADGTKMWVNSNTRVIYPVQFAKGKREIFVEGETFLDVNRNEKIPFIVKTRKIDVTVLGTQFNVSTADNGSISEVVLVSGKVEVKTSLNKKSILYPSQLFSYNALTDKSNIKEVDISGYVAWKDGYYQFHRQSLDVVLKRISKFYGAQIEWDENVKKLTCSGKLDLKDDLASVLELLTKAAPIKIKKQNEIIHIYVKP
ncbi:MAG: FecR domain-containing protein [Tannerellaceae bacterium]|jgi:ferric-dicitrate binding protein FerR (iron transport regulator)|nr:FecR domain-containing protein [Tannerellaceae bacterium]